MEEYAGAAFSGPILYSNLVALKLWPVHITCVGLGLEHMHVVLCCPVFTVAKTNGPDANQRTKTILRLPEFA